MTSPSNNQRSFPLTLEKFSSDFCCFLDDFAKWVKTEEAEACPIHSSHTRDEEGGEGRPPLQSDYGGVHVPSLMLGLKRGSATVRGAITVSTGPRRSLPTG